MQLTRHLSNEELSEIIFASDQQHLRRTLGTLPEWARAAAEHPDAFWERQQAEIRKRISSLPDPSSSRSATAWAGAFAVVLLAIFLLHGSPAARPSNAQNDPDQELLIAVEQSLQSGLPQALEPAALLANEISNSQPISTPRRVYKENPNEDRRTEGRRNADQSNEDQ
jgi:hypothetical protein